MRVKIIPKKKYIKYIVIIEHADLEGVTFKQSEIMEMRKLDASRQPNKLLFSLLMKARAIDRQKPMIYKERKSKKWKKTT